jgi:hypothetical protein
MPISRRIAVTPAIRNLIVNNRLPDADNYIMGQDDFATGIAYPLVAGSTVC